jgi:hypothetical protein
MSFFVYRKLRNNILVEKNYMTFKKKIVKNIIGL